MFYDNPIFDRRKLLFILKYGKAQVSPNDRGTDYTDGLTQVIDDYEAMSKSLLRLASKVVMCMAC